MKTEQKHINQQTAYTCTYSAGLVDYTARGYTGHEHLDMFGLINMNGRMYDYTLGRFLSPDPYVLDPTYTQDYNRYTYARNNALTYFDPSGYATIRTEDRTINGGTIPGVEVHGKPIYKEDPGKKDDLSDWTQNPNRGWNDWASEGIGDYGGSGGGGGETNTRETNKLIYNKTFNRIGFVPLDENVGFQWANYKMRLRIWQNGDNQLSLLAETFNTPVDGTVVATASAKLIVDGVQRLRQALSLNGHYIYPAGGFEPLGNAFFTIPTNGNVSINFQGGWIVFMNGGSAVPVGHPILNPVSININQRIRIR